MTEIIKKQIEQLLQSTEMTVLLKQRLGDGDDRAEPPPDPPQPRGKRGKG